MSASLQYYVVICDQKKKKKFMELVSDYGGVSTNVMYGKGSAKSGAFAQALGFETEENKVVITCLIPTPQARALTEVLKNEHDFIGKNTGISFSIPLGGLSI